MTKDHDVAYCNTQALRFRKTALALALSQILVLGTPVALAAKIRVDTDSGGANDPNQCTLRDAITAANTDTATGGCRAGAGADTIVLPARATITLTEPDNPDNGLPVVTSAITIEGNGTTINRDSGSPQFRIFKVAHGSLELKDTVVSHGGVYDNGGGILLTDSTVTLINSIVSMNRTHGPYGGGGIDASNSTLALISSTVSGNSCYFGGGGIMGSNTMITLTNSTISGNNSPSWGSGVLSGGISSGDIAGSTLTLINSTISGNTGSSGITVSNTKIKLINSTVSENSVSSNYYNSGGIHAQRSTQEFILQNSIIANNSSGRDCRNYSSITPISKNTLIGDGGINCGTPLLTGNPKLGPLQNNGGPTPTHALLADSPAIDAGDDAICDTLPKNARDQPTDQRGKSRTGPRAGLHCDIGAYEFRHRRRE